MSLQTKTKRGLSSLSVSQLRLLCKKRGIKVRGKTGGDMLFGTYKMAPSKKQYINALSKAVSSRDIASAKRAKPVTKKRRRRQSSFWSLW
ncbi:MAG: hypothetical protein MN733_14415 [Nitrososphaera sp.]|nr:hypothetical protein [Nitrososphaera sp.]